MISESVGAALAMAVRAAGLDQHEIVDIGLTGKRVRWRKFGVGTGRACVLLHGGHGSWLHWIRNIGALAASREVWVPDMPGFGESEGEPPHGEAAARLAWVEGTLLDSAQQLPLACAAPDVVGFSFGAIVAAALADGLGARRLVFIGPAGHGAPRRRDFVFQDWQGAPTVADARAALRHNLEVLMLARGSETDGLALAIHEDGCRNCRVSSRSLSFLKRLPTRVAELSIPVLGIWGDDDPTGTAASAAQALGLGAPQRAWQEVAGAGHWAQYQQPDAVNRLLLEWLA